MSWSDIVDIFKDVAPIAVPIAGAVLSNKQADKALSAQQAAADKSAEITKEMFDASRADLAPYRSTGQAANRRLSQLMGLDEYNRDDIRAQLAKQFPVFFPTKKEEPKAATSSLPSFYDQIDPLELELRRREQDYRANDLFTPQKFQKRIGGLGNMNMDVVLRDFKDGQVNPNTGETFDKKRYLQYLKASEDLAAAYPRGNFDANWSSMPKDIKAAFDAEQEAIHRMTYQPSRSKQSFLGRILPTLAIAGITAGAGFAGAPALASNIVKGATTLSRIGTGN